MSLGLGRIERTIIAFLTPDAADPWYPPRSASDIAEAMFRGEATEAGLVSMRRALRALERKKILVRKSVYRGGRTVFGWMLATAATEQDRLRRRNAYRSAKRKRKAEKRARRV